MQSRCMVAQCLFSLSALATDLVGVYLCSIVYRRAQLQGAGASMQLFGGAGNDTALFESAKALFGLAGGPFQLYQRIYGAFAAIPLIS